MRMNKLAARTALSVAIVACWLSTPSQAQTAPQVKDDDLCPPLATARRLGLLAVITSQRAVECNGKKDCRVDVDVTMKDNVCIATVPKRIDIQKNKDADDPKNKGKPRGKVPEITWRINPDPSLSNEKFQFHEEHGIRFLPPKSDEETNDPDQDFHSKDVAKQTFKWKNRHLRKAEVRYCPYVIRVYRAVDGKEVRQNCAGRDPLILNQ